MSTKTSPPEARSDQTYEAGCHCGYIKFSVTLSPPLPEYEVVQCDCSACRRFGYLLVCKSSMRKDLLPRKIGNDSLLILQVHRLTVYPNPSQIPPGSRFNGTATLGAASPSIASTPSKKSNCSVDNVARALALTFGISTRPRKCMASV